jgi:hypothetical protein
MSSWGLSWLTSWAQSWGPTGSGDEPHGHAGPSLVVKSRKLIRKRVMMRALLMARR